MPELTKVETSVGKGEGAYTYTVECQRFTSLEDYYSSLPADKDGAQCALEISNAQNEQGAKQGKKEAVRDAIAKGDDKATKEAVKAHKEWAAGYVISGSTGRVGGITKTKAGEVGKALLNTDPEKLKAIAAELGVEL